MRFPSPLRRGRLVQRYKRFFADVALEGGETVTAHCPNPGAMLGLNQPRMTVWVSRSDSPTRKLPHTLELVEADDGLVGVNTHRPNALAAEALAQGALPELAGYEIIRREVRYGSASRVDFLLEGAGRPRCWLEVKSVTLARERGLAEWPDCVSKRAAAHVHELAATVADGDRAVVLFLIQRPADAFRIAADLDPAFAQALDQAAEAGVEVLAYACDLTPESIRVARRVPATP